MLGLKLLGYPVFTYGKCKKCLRCRHRLWVSHKYWKQPRWQFGYDPLLSILLWRQFCYLLCWWYCTDISLVNLLWRQAMHLELLSSRQEWQKIVRFDSFWKAQCDTESSLHWCLVLWWYFVKLGCLWSILWRAQDLLWFYSHRIMWNYCLLPQKWYCWPWSGLKLVVLSLVWLQWLGLMSLIHFPWKFR